MRLIGRLIYRHMGMFLTAVVFLTVEAVADLLQPMLMSHVVDDGVKRLDTAAVCFYGLVMLGVAAAGAVGAVMRNIYASRTSQLIGMELRSELYRKVQSLSFENIDRLSPASLITRITNDVTQIQNFINGCMRILVKAPITCMGAIILIVLKTPSQLPVMVAILLAAALLITGNMAMGYPRFERMQKKLDRLNQVSREFLTSIRVVKAFGAEQEEADKFEAAADELAGAGISAMRVMAVFSPLINLSVNLGIVFLLWAAQMNPGAGIGKLMASVNYMTQIVFALGMVSNILNMSVRAQASAERVGQVLREVPAQNASGGRMPARNESGERMPARDASLSHTEDTVEFCDVSFTYAGSAVPSISHISFRTEPGMVLGMIGTTGSGKTTLVSLIPRFYDATEGRILIGGEDVNSMDSHTLRSRIAVVPQKALLFTGTIEYNLKWGKENATAGELDHALWLSCADEFTGRLERGVKTVLGQGGVNLSGGQKQRLSLARALMKEPSILILDDCTSALDAITEAAVLQRLRDEDAGRTVFLISQRISTVMGADRILCMKDGCAVGFGTHGQLMKECKEYREIYESQMGGGADAGQ